MLFYSFVNWHFDVVFFNCWGLGFQRKKNFGVLLLFFVYFVWICYDVVVDYIYILSGRYHRLWSFVNLFFFQVGAKVSLVHFFSSFCKQSSYVACTFMVTWSSCGSPHSRVSNTCRCIVKARNLWISSIFSSFVS